MKRYMPIIESTEYMGEGATLHTLGMAEDANGQYVSYEEVCKFLKLARRGCCDNQCGVPLLIDAILQIKETL